MSAVRPLIVIEVEVVDTTVKTESVDFLYANAYPDAFVTAFHLTVVELVVAVVVVIVGVPSFVGATAPYS